MKRVQLLSDEVIKKIAAGEVVERPASVVKELVENSIDAGARKIHIELEEGGSKRISVQDDGCGILPEDCMLALRRHATSKISRDEDLFAISTLGFRGEALAAISAVSDFSLGSRVRGAEAGCKITIENASSPESDVWSGPEGTIITVRKLFCTVPVRAKFLKGPETEFAHCYELIQALALASPELAFTLEHNGKLKFSAPALKIDTVENPWRGESILRERWELVVGKEEAQDAIYVREENEYGRWEALISPPGHDKASQKNVVHFANGRWVKDKVLKYGILRGYHSHLLKGRHPQVLSFFDCDPSLIDVNVHPAKTELRFQYPAEVQGLMSYGIRKHMREAAWADDSYKASRQSASELKRFSRMPAPEEKESPAMHASEFDKDNNLEKSMHSGSAFSSLPFSRNVSTQMQSVTQQTGSSSTDWDRGNVSSTDWGGGFQKQNLTQQTGSSSTDWDRGNVSSTDWDRGSRTYQSSDYSNGLNFASADEVLRDGSEEKGDPKYMRFIEPSFRSKDLDACITGDAFSSSADVTKDLRQSNERNLKFDKETHWQNLRYIGNYAKCYLLFEQDDGKLLSIDQHAFHERILYEKLCANPKLLAESQALILPEAVTMSPQEVSALREHMEIVQSAGFSLQCLGEDTVEIRAVPTLMVHKRYDDFFLKLAEKISEGSVSSAAQIHHELLASIACHAAVRGGDDLSEEEIRVLLAEAGSVDFYHNCPHGRRVFKVFDKSHVAGWFDR